MAEDIKNLIEKIQQEGVLAAEDKARRIENQAKQTAKDIIAKANSQAEQIIAEAEDSVAKIQESSKSSLKNAGRDLLLSLRKEMNVTLDKIISSSISESLKPEELVKIITTLVKNCSDDKKQEIIISLKKEDLVKLEKGFLGKLKNETKKGIVLKQSDDIHGGFIISYDGGKSHYDFTNKSLAEYISVYLDPKLRELLKDSVSKK